MLQEIELIQSNYFPEEAMEVLGNLIQQKIAYHTQKTLRHQEMFGTPDAQAEIRLVELQKPQNACIGGYGHRSARY
jgi:hypothetical protein